CSYSVPSFSTMSLMVTYIAWSETGVLILYVEPIRTSGRSTFSCIRMTLAVLPFLSRKTSSPAETLLSGGFSSGFLTRYLTILRSIFMALTWRHSCKLQGLTGSVDTSSLGRPKRLAEAALSEPPVVTLLHGVVEIGGAVLLAVILDLLVAL